MKEPKLEDIIDIQEVKDIEFEEKKDSDDVEFLEKNELIEEEPVYTY